MKLVIFITAAMLCDLKIIPFVVRQLLSFHIVFARLATNIEFALKITAVASINQIDYFYKPIVNIYDLNTA